MKSNIYLSLISVIIVGGLVSGCASGSGDNGGDKKAQLEQLKTERAEIEKKIQSLEAELAKSNPEASNVKAKDVTVSELSTRKFDHYIQTQGTVESEQSVMVSAKTIGIITAVLVKEGAMVTKGQTLAQIDNTLVLRGIDELKLQMELANTVYERQKNLWDQKIGTEVQYLQAKNAKEGLEKKLASMNEQNEMTRIKSPINGVVDAVEIKVGQNIAPGMPAARVVNNNELKVMAGVSESHVTKLNKGDKVVVIFPGVGKSLEARASFVGRSIDPVSRTFNIEASLPDNPSLRPNMTAIVKIVYKSFDKALVVPVNVVQNVNGEKIIYVVESKDNKTVARKRVVEVAGVYDNLAQVTKGLNPGDKIITTGYQGLNDGELVKM